MGAPDRGPNGQGAVYAYEYDGSNWIETILQAQLPVNNSQFGADVALDGTLAVVNADNLEQVYVLTRGTSAWSEDILTPSNTPANASYGRSVSVCGQRVVVGAPGANATYVYDFNGVSWDETILTPPTASAGDQFGNAVDCDGDIVVVASNGVATGRGTAWLFELSGGSWRRIEILPSSLVGVHNYGSAVSVAGSRVLVGATGFSTNRGAAFVFERIALNSWTDTTLTASDAMLEDAFGNSVAADGDWLVCGAWQLGNGGSGKVYSFTPAGNSWIERAVSPPGTTDAFGEAVDVSGFRLLVGTTQEGSTGAVHLYQQLVP